MSINAGQWPPMVCNAIINTKRKMQVQCTKKIQDTKIEITKQATTIKKKTHISKYYCKFLNTIN